MVERLLPAIATAAAPLVGLMLRASRRNRLQRRIEEYLALADRMREHDPEAAAACAVFAAECVRQLIGRGQQALRRRFDPIALFGTALVAAPGVIGFVLAAGWNTGWRWPVMGVSALWTVLALIAGAGQVWSDKDESETTSASAATG